MPRKCSICEHPQRLKIDQAITEGRSFSAIAREYGVSRDSVRRHKNNGHVVREIVKAGQAREVAEAGSLLEQVQQLHRRAMGILNKAEGADQLRTAVAGIREVRGVLELLARLQGELADITIEVHPEWQAVKSIFISALQEHPDALEKALQRAEEILHVQADRRFLPQPAEPRRVG